MHETKQDAHGDMTLWRSVA